MRPSSVIHRTLLAGVFCLIAASSGLSQFDSGSDGSYGAIKLTDGSTVTLDMPADGIFHCTTITVSNGSRLEFNKNPANTPVFLLATGDVNVDNGFIDANGSVPNGPVGGRGGPGGFSGGNGTTTGQSSPGAGQGPGGGGGGVEEQHETTNNAPGIVGNGFHGVGIIGRLANGPTYGNALLIPLIGGSGGGGTSNGIGGGGGGGAILIASNTRIVIQNGAKIHANGWNAPENGTGKVGGSGSGGSIRLVAPIVSGNGELSANSHIKFNRSTGGAGKVRIDALIYTDDLSIAWDASLAVGRNMVVFPPNPPVIEIVEAAGVTVDPAANLPVTVFIQPGQPSQQAVKVRVTNFSGTAQLKVVLTPEYGSQSSYDLDIDTTLGDPDEDTVDVIFPANQLTRVDVWTR